MTKKAILAALSAVLAMIGCSGTGSEPPVTYEIGDFGPSGVGIVFYITDGGLHGLEAAPADQSASQAWIEGSGPVANTSNGNTETAIGTGSANTDTIIAQAGHGTSAAEVCRDHTGGGLNDWFLPSKDELNELYTQRLVVGGFSNAYYWSSSEDTAANAWAHSFDTDYPNAISKTGASLVRAVRAF